jgi:hypothetical protein
MEHSQRGGGGGKEGEGGRGEGTKHDHLWTGDEIGGHIPLAGGHITTEGTGQQERMRGH